jgi:type II secretion system protein N
MRRVLYYVGMFVLALVTFVFAVQATFPYDRVKQKLEEAASSKYDLAIFEIDRGIMPGVFYLKNVTLKTRPSKDELEKAFLIADQKERDKAIAQLSTTIYVEELKVNIGLLGFIGGTASVDFDATIGDGNISGNVSVAKDGTTLHIEGSDVPSHQLPMREVLSNLPMSGEIDFEVDLDLPNEKLKSGKVGPNWQEATGALEFSCPAGCVIGDGKAKLKLKAKNQRSQAFAGEGTDFGRVKIQSLLAKAELKDGKFDITKFETKSSDVELFVDLTMTLAQEVDQSAVMGCLRFKPSEALKKREPKTYDQILLTGAARHSDGLDHIKLTGTIKTMKKLPEVCGPGIKSGGSRDDPGGKPSRPNLAIQPDEPLKAGSAATGGAPTPAINLPSPVLMHDAGVAADAAVNVPVPGPGSEHQLPSVGSGSADGHGSGSDVAPPNEGSARAGHDR